MLDRAKRLLLNTLEVLDQEIADEIPIVVLEPSCASVFRDEMPNLFPDNASAKKLSQQVLLLSEFLENKSSHFIWPRISSKTVVHLHCHQKSLLKMTSQQNLPRPL